MYLFLLLTNWALVCDVWYLPKMTRQVQRIVSMNFNTLTIAFLVAGLYANFDVLDFRLLTSWRFTINNFPWTTGGRERCTICKSCQDRDCSSGRAGWPYLVRFCSDTDNFVHEMFSPALKSYRIFPVENQRYIISQVLKLLNSNQRAGQRRGPTVSRLPTNTSATSCAQLPLN